MTLQAQRYSSCQHSNALYPDLMAIVSQVLDLVC